MLSATASTSRGLLRVAVTGSRSGHSSTKIPRTDVLGNVLRDRRRSTNGFRVGTSPPVHATAGNERTASELLSAAATAAAVSAVLWAQQQRLGRGEEDGTCLCKDKTSAADSLQDYARRLQRLRSLRDIFKEYATVNADDVGLLMTCGDFLRAMLCYKYVRVDAKEVKRRCARYINPLLGDDHGLISFDEFCFLLSLISIPAGLFDVAFAAADADGSGTIDVDELDRLVKRLAPPREGGGDSGSNKGDQAAGDGEEKNRTRLTGHKRLAAAWFGKEGDEGQGGGGRVVNREQFKAFVRDLRLDVKTVECRLYSRSIRFDEDEDEAPITNRRSWRAWIGLGGRGGGSRGQPTGSSSTPEVGEGTGAGWWSRYESETISMADLALTLVSTCHPRDMPAFLARVQAIEKKRTQVPLRDALLLHEILEDHAQDLEDALGMYSKASSGGAVVPADFARAAKVISGKDLSPECVWLVFKMFDRGGDGKLDHDELIEATRDRLRRLPGQRESSNRAARFVQCVRGDS